MILSSPLRHLYVHVPFCPSICPYCDFHVLLRRGDLVQCYLDGIEAEAARLAASYTFELETVYLGGGTPSFLRGDELAALVGSVRRHLGWGSQENTLEVNPGTVSPARAAHWRTLGFDRASVGVQSLDDATLRFLGRQHTAQAAREAVTLLRGAGFRVSGDLITAVAGQPLESDVAGLVALGAEHVSAYTLTIEDGTPFARQGVTVSDDDEERGFTVTERELEAAGYRRYEISNYARPGAESRHNLAYWTGAYFAGLGPGAAGFYPGLPGHPPERRTNRPLHAWLAGEPPDTEALAPDDLATDAFFMGLRLAAGLDLTALSQRSGLDVRARYAAVIADQVRAGLLTDDGQRLRATPQGWWVLNRVVTAFLDA